MAEYLIQEETLVELADAVRIHFKDLDAVTQLIEDRNNIVNIIIPEGTTNIGGHVFLSCPGLTSITIPNSVTSIGEQSFAYCYTLADMYMLPTTPPTIHGTNSISDDTTAIHVPIGSGDAYRTATNWSSFADIIVEDIEI